MWRKMKTMTATTRFFLWMALAAVAIYVGGEVASKSAIAAEGGKALVIYYSWSGNSETIAQQIQNKTGGDILKLELVKPYSSNYNACVEEWKRERDTGADRELKTRLPNLVQYGTIYICYPIWSSTIPTPIATMLRQNDFSGKFIMPVASHGGGGAGKSALEIARLVPKAKVAEALSLYGTGGDSLSSSLDDWMVENGRVR